MGILMLRPAAPTTDTLRSTSVSSDTSINFSEKELRKSGIWILLVIATE